MCRLIPTEIGEGHGYHRDCYNHFTKNVERLKSTHAYQSLACETAINTDLSELFSLKRIYVKYKNAFLLLIDCFFHT